MLSDGQTILFHLIFQKEIVLDGLLSTHSICHHFHRKEILLMLCWSISFHHQWREGIEGQVTWIEPTYLNSNIFTSITPWNEMLNLKFLNMITSSPKSCNLHDLIIRIKCQSCIKISMRIKSRLLSNIINTLVKRIGNSCLYLNADV